MIVQHDPDAFVGVSGHRTCPFHQKHPGRPYAGCTCSAFYGLRPATPDEHRENRRKRLTRELREAEEHVADLRRQLAPLLLSDSSDLPPEG